MSWRRRFCSVSVFVAVNALPAKAGLVTWEVSGVTTYIIDEVGIFSDFVQVNSPFSVSFTFDSMTPDTRTHSGNAIYVDAILDMSGVLGELSFSGTGR